MLVVNFVVFANMFQLLYNFYKNPDIMTSAVILFFLVITKTSIIS